MTELNARQADLSSALCAAVRLFWAVDKVLLDRIPTPGERMAHANLLAELINTARYLEARAALLDDTEVKARLSAAIAHLEKTRLERKEIF